MLTPVAKALPILMYHHVSPNNGLVTVSPATFRRQMKWLHAHHYQSVTCADLERFLAGEPLPGKRVMISFDDGFLDNYVYAYPILREYGLHAILFLVTGWLGEGKARAHAEVNVNAHANPQPNLPETPNHHDCMARINSGAPDSVMLRWSEIELMQAAGSVEFHSHTHTHTRWDKIINMTKERNLALCDDLERSKEALKTHLGACSSHLCWPQGFYDEDYIHCAKNAGFDFLYTVNKGVNTPRTNPQAINRIVVKDKPGTWFASRLWLYRQARLGQAYVQLRGQ